MPAGSYCVLAARVTLRTVHRLYITRASSSTIIVNRCIAKQLAPLPPALFLDCNRGRNYHIGTRSYMDSTKDGKPQFEASLTYIVTYHVTMFYDVITRCGQRIALLSVPITWSASAYDEDDLGGKVGTRLCQWRACLNEYLLRIKSSQDVLNMRRPG